MHDINCIILAAGKGTRMKSDKPKVTFKLAGKSLVKRVFESVQPLSLKRIVVVVGYRKEDVIAVLPPDKLIEFVEQKEQLGTGHAVKVTENLLAEESGSTVILCGDVPLLKTKTIDKLLKKHLSSESDCTVLTADMEDPGFYGRIERDSNNEIVKITEFKDATDDVKALKEINTGIYCFKNKLLFEKLNDVSNKNNQNEYYLTDLIAILKKQNFTIKTVKLEDVNEISGVNNIYELSLLEKHYYDDLKKEHMLNGVTIENPQSVLIEDEVFIEPGVIISANTIIKNKTSIYADSFIGPNCYIENSLINSDVRLNGFNIVINNKIDSGRRLNYKESLINE